MFIVGKIRAWTGEMIHPQSQNKEMEMWGFEPNYLSPNPLFILLRLTVTPTVLTPPLQLLKVPPYHLIS